jgi:hypothetical protein
MYVAVEKETINILVHAFFTLSREHPTRIWRSRDEQERLEVLSLTTGYLNTVSSTRVWVIIRKHGFDGAL